MTNKYRFFFTVLVLLLTCSLVHSPRTCAQPLTHVVQKGDTLWDICELYYGDPNLWPELWEMNQFVTNPHLLEPGDVLTLLENVPTLKTKEEKFAVQKPKVLEPEGPVGIDVSGLTNTDTLGYLSDVEAELWGNLFASEDDRMLLSPGDKVYVRITKQGARVEPGDEFSICQRSPLIKHPITGEEMGYVLTVRGRLVIEEPVGHTVEEGKLIPKKNTYKATLLSCFKTLSVGDSIVPYEPVSSPCVLPQSMNRSLVGHVVATQDETSILATSAVVYIDCGLDKGVQKGHLFQVIREHVVPDPDTKGFRLTKRPELILPDIHLATILVLESRKKTATAVVLSSEEDFPVGSPINALSWSGEPDILSKIATCSVE
ncbi:MAG: LysM peptidoglycan-binding domain-containing protein [Deltaproteobacteria bacterium]|nr:LysM peptidoglycan-binding domain-containing protein [Deltaproteobacteria bacterium]